MVKKAEKNWSHPDVLPAPVRSSWVGVAASQPDRDAVTTAPHSLAGRQPVLAFLCFALFAGVLQQQRNGQDLGRVREENGVARP
ncbi:MAG: hypothetical protein KJ069_07405 [Anaerolineae bacterium]|nr:hypothetical protein [Anaerolineae bacterium]